MNRLMPLLCSLLFAVVAHAAVPDVQLTDASGRDVHVYRDLMQGRTVAVNFVFTSCTTICTPMGATFEKLQSLVDASRVRLISVSIDPATDTPERMSKWGARFHAGPSWSLLTGTRDEVDKLRKAFGLYTPDRFAHTPTVVVVSASGEYTRVNGIGNAAEIAKALRAADDPAAQYFGGLALVDENGAKVDFYADLLEDHVVVVNSFFASCKGSCPLMAGAFQNLQTRFERELGHELTLISISVDPEHDTPAALAAYARRVGAKKGWHFLTGSKSDVDAALHKLGQYAETPAAHSNVIIVGNLRTGLWKKAFGLSGAGAIGDVVQSVLDDK